MANYHINDMFCKAKGINYDLKWIIIYQFCEPINDDKDLVKTVFFLVGRD